MDVLEAMRQRRSVRKYRDSDVDDATIMSILGAARWAPTGGNMQPWEFVVVRDPALKKRLVDCTYTGYLEKSGNPQRWMMAAPVVVVACVNQKRTGASYGEAGKRIAVMDVSAAIENVLLAATSMGLASCWVSGFAPAGVSEAVGLPRWVEPVALLSVGYAESVPPAPPKLEAGDYVFREAYGRSFE